MTVCPSRRSAVSGRLRPRGRDRRRPPSCRALPSATERTIGAAADPFSRDGSKVRDLPESGSRVRARADRIAAASGCSLARSSAAASRTASASDVSPTGTIDTSFGLPSVSVPVLSTTSVSTLLEPLERFGVFQQHAGRGAAAGADHDRHRRRQAQRAGAGDDQHRDRADQRVREPRLGPARCSTRRTRATATSTTAGTK